MSEEDIDAIGEQMMGAIERLPMLIFANIGLKQAEMLAFSQAISAKRQADALERIAEPFEKSTVSVFDDERAVRVR